jgi:hypothetical protein
MRPAAEESAPATTSAPDIVSVKDSTGRTITLRTLSVIQEMRLLKVLGEFNGSYYSFCSQVARVSAIDGDQIPVPNSERQIEAVAQQLGKEGVAALMSAVVASAEQDQDAEKEAVKK